MKTRTLSNGKVYSYLRFSSEPQSWGDSERRQQALAENWCKQQGRTLAAETFADRGVSGWKGANRKDGALGALLRLAGPGDTILIEDCDRWSREPVLDSLNAKRETCNRGVSLHFLKTGMTVSRDNFNDAAVILPAFIQSFLANSDNEKRSYRIKQAMNTRRATVDSGKAVRGRLPAWLEWSKELNGPVLVPHKAKVIREIFDLCLAGTGCREITRIMVRRNEPPMTGHKRASWNNWNVYRFLTDKSALGYHYYALEKRYSDKPVYPPVVDEKTFYAAAAKLKERQRFTQPWTRESRNLFTGLLRCAKCGQTMTRQTVCNHGKYKYAYLICSGNLRGSSGCGWAGIRFEDFERSMLTVLADSKLIAKCLSGPDVDAELAAAKGKLADVEKQAEKILRLIEGMDTPPQRLVDRLQALETEENALREDVMAREARAATPPARAYEGISDELAGKLADPETRRKVRVGMRGFIDRVTVDLKASAYEIHFKGGRLPVTVIVREGGVVIGPAPCQLESECLTAA